MSQALTYLALCMLASSANDLWTSANVLTMAALLCRLTQSRGGGMEKWTRLCVVLQQPRISAKNAYSSEVSNQQKLHEVGKFEVQKRNDYEAGQLFLHRIFAYRGVILFSSSAKVFDRTNEEVADLTADDDALPSGLSPSGMNRYTKTTSSGREVAGTSQTYYAALFHEDDWPFVRMPKEMVTFFASEGQQGHYSIAGMDYVGHDDIMPFASDHSEPIRHPLFSNFFVDSAAPPAADPAAAADAADADQAIVPPPSTPKAVGKKQNRKKSRKTIEASLLALKKPKLLTSRRFTPSEQLKAWHARNQTWLELRDVHRATTENIRVTVIPFFVGQRYSHGENAGPSYWWRYTVRLENLGRGNVTLRTRHWRIFSMNGTLETTDGRGVLGQQGETLTVVSGSQEPCLSALQPAFQYASHVSLQCPSGHMWGTFTMERENGTTFDCRIPPFTLESKAADNAVISGV